MYIISLTYKVPVETIDPFLAEHVSYLEEYYTSGVFLLSGRKVPRTGGVIIARAENMESVLEIIKKDPFHVHDFADYEITEIVPSKAHKDLQFLI